MEKEKNVLIYRKKQPVEASRDAGSKADRGRRMKTCVHIGNS